MTETGRLAELILFIVVRHPLALLVTLFLLLASATMSSCETALFSLTPPEVNRLRSLPGRLNHLIDLLYSQLNQLMSTLLFCNMAVNVLLFAMSTVIGLSLVEVYGTSAAFLYGLVNLGMVIFCGEVFPKQLAIAAHLTVARLTVVPVWLCHRLVGRPLRVLNTVTRVCERVINLSRHDSVSLKEEEFKLLIEVSKSDGVITNDEYELIYGIVDLPNVKIKDLMTPRIDAVMVKPDTTGEDIVKLAHFCGHNKLPIINVEQDELIGWVNAHDFLLDSSKADASAAHRRFRYFSEHDRVDQILRRLKSSRDELLAVVDERGSVVGVFTLHDIMAEVLGDFGEHGTASPEDIVETTDGYALAGGVSVREWRELFGVASAIPNSTTVGGLVVSLLGRPARLGDKVKLENMEMAVLSVWRNRVTRVMVRLLAPGAGRTDKNATD
ncbi:MAG: CNNM domain-containing protein [Planctomycetota bacterium]|jgi:putative hemolysin|nr:CNNM domain-containing protein [Planctomycetota bacterium]